MPSCKLVIQDEVNIKLEGLPVEIRRKLANAFKYEVGYAKYHPAYKLGRWDGTVSLFGLGGNGYLSQLPRILDILDKNNISVDEIEDLRNPVKLDFPKIAVDFWGDRCWPAGHRFEGQPIRLREDQVEVVNRFLENPQCLQEIATGFGKCLAGETSITIEAVLDSSFGEFLLSKQSFGPLRISQLTLPIGVLASYIEEYTNTRLKNNQEVAVDDLKISVATPTGTVLVRHFVKKTNLPMLKIALSNGYSFRAATTHLIRVNGADTYLKDLAVGTVVDHRDSNSVKVTSIVESGVDDCYDIAIAAPHLYYDANGLVHHNTITTATLAKLCESHGRTITVVPNKSLVEQTEEDFINVGLDVGVYYGDRKELGKTHTICTWQSLNILDKKTKNQVDALTLAQFLDGVKTVMIDECFSGDTQVLTPTGNVPIKNLSPGDKIINLCETTKTYKEDTVVKVHKNLTVNTQEPMLRLQFDNGVTTDVTANHKFLTSQGWVRADELTSDHDIISVDTVV